MTPIERGSHVARILSLLERFPVVALLGARQVGKSTLARQVAAARGGSEFFDLEHPTAARRLENPALALEPLRGLVVLDEIQFRPELFGVLRVLADREGAPARFLILGSASPDLVQRGADSLAGRIAFHRLPGFALAEVGAASVDELWLRGGFPRSFVAATEADSAEWRREFVRTYVERDLNLLGLRLQPDVVRRFWTMLAHYHGQTWNALELARAFGVSNKTVRHYLDVLCATFMARRLLPWFENAGKRLVKSPKVYLTDTGILHTLLQVETREALLSHPKVGASFEGFVIDQLVQHTGAREEECFCWSTYAGAELDLLLVRGRTRRGFEVKLTDAPRTTKSMHAAIEALGLDALDVVHAGASTFLLAPRIRAVSVRRLLEEVEPLPAE